MRHSPRSNDSARSNRPAELPQEAIAAPATPRGTSALAMVRLSGRGCGRIVESLMRIPEGSLAEGRMRRVGEVYGPEGSVDSVVAIYWREGASYTGEEMVEVCCHGVPRIVDRLMELVMACGARAAESGEFTRRALLNGRMTALSVIELAAVTAGWHPVAEGGLEEEVGRAREAAARAAEALEGEIEFGEARDEVEADAERALEALAEAVDVVRAAVRAAEGERRVVVMGPTNSGKSSFVNRLAGAEVALVHERPGTTRDGASAIARIAGGAVRVYDSAGAGVDGMDAVAYGRTVDSLDSSTCVIWMESAPSVRAPRGIREAAGTVMEISSRADLYEGGDRRMSLVTGEGWDRTVERLETWASSGRLSGSVGVIARACGRAKDLVAAGDFAVAAEELASVERALQALGDGDGFGVESAVERALKRLCVGK